jgi:hypothetical protein
MDFVRKSPFPGKLKKMLHNRAVTPNCGDMRMHAPRCRRRVCRAAASLRDRRVAQQNFEDASFAMRDPGLYSGT